MSLKIVEPAFPQAAEWLDPVCDIPKSGRHEFTRPALRVAPAFDKARFLQHFEMLRDGWLTQFERCHKLGYRCLAYCQASKNCTPRRVGQGREGLVQLVGMMPYNCHTAI